MCSVQINGRCRSYSQLFKQLNANGAFTTDPEHSKCASRADVSAATHKLATGNRPVCIPQSVSASRNGVYPPLNAVKYLQTAV